MGLGFVMGTSSRFSGLDFGVLPTRLGFLQHSIAFIPFSGIGIGPALLLY